MTATINARHRKHYKSGSCLQQHSLERPLVISKKFARFLALFDQEGRLAREEREIEDIRKEMRAQRKAEVAEMPANAAPRSTQSIFGRIASKVAGMFRGKVA